MSLIFTKSYLPAPISFFIGWLYIHKHILFNWFTNYSSQFDLLSRNRVSFVFLFGETFHSKFIRISFDGSLELLSGRPGSVISISQTKPNELQARTHQDGPTTGSSASDVSESFAGGARLGKRRAGLWLSTTFSISVVNFDQSILLFLSLQIKIFRLQSIDSNSICELALIQNRTIRQLETRYHIHPPPTLHGIKKSQISS